MDKETLRRQIHDELLAEFGSKLKEARRQKRLVEEELENNSERWRTERRRLNAEVDRLEAALADAKEPPRRRGAAEKPVGIDPLEVAKIQAAADERLNKATNLWEAERAQLKSEIGRLQKAVAEAIERSSNPLRAAMPIKQELEARIQELQREKAELEAAFGRAKAEWEQERLKLAGEMVKLRRLVPAKPGLRGKFETEEEARIKALEKQVEVLENASREWEKERKHLSGHAAQLQQAFIETQAKLERFEASAKTIDHEARMQEATRVKAALEQDFQRARNEWDAERRRLNSEIDRLKQAVPELSETRDRVSNEVVEQLRRQYDQKIQEIIHQKTRLSQQLQSATAELESERARFTAEIAKSTSAESAAQASADVLNPEVINTELARVEALIQELVDLVDNPDTDLSTVIRKNVEKAELDAYLKGILFSMGRSRGL